MFLASASKVFQMGAEWAMKLRRGGMDLPMQEASVKVVLGVRTNWEPVLRPEEDEKEVGSQTVKQVG